MAPDLLQHLERAGIVGCAVGRLRRGQEAEFAFHGHCSSGGDPISADVLWEAASLGKPVVALLAAKRAKRVRPTTGEAIVVFTNDDNGQALYRELCREFLAVEVW